MAKLYFYYSAMNAGKTTILLQAAHNYQERGMDTLLFTSTLDTRYQKNRITSRIGLEAEAQSFDKSFDFYTFIRQALAENPQLKCILVDEAQFLSKAQVRQLLDVVDKLNMPVLCYGIRSDFQGEPFEGSTYLLVWADSLQEIKTICHCGKKAMMNQRINTQGQVIKKGSQIHIGGNESYQALCRKHFFQDLDS